MVISKHKIIDGKRYVRRGFDIRFDLYHKFKALAAEKGVYTRDLLQRAIARELKAAGLIKDKDRQ